MNYVLLFLVLVFMVGCSEDGASEFSAGKEHLASGNVTAAWSCFERASSSDGPCAGEAHYELGRLARGREGGLPLALWHFRQASELYPREGVKAQEIASALEECAESLLGELTVGSQSQHRQGDDLRLKVDLLEEHARKQSRWLDELRRENALLRRQLSERE